MFPLDYGAPRSGAWQLDAQVEQASDPNSGWREEVVDDLAAGSRSDLMHVRFVAAERRLDYWVDVAHGCVPRAITESGPRGATVRIYYTGLRQTSDACWIPMRELVVFADGLTKEIAVTRAETGAMPERASFQISLPPTVKVLDVARKLVYPGSATWRLSALPSPGRAGVRPIVLNPPVPSAPEPQERRSAFGGLNVYLLLSVVLLLAAALGFILRRRR